MNTGKYDIDWFVKKLQEDEEQNPYVKKHGLIGGDYVQDLKYITYHRGEPLIHGSTYRMLEPVK